MSLAVEIATQSAFALDGVTELLDSPTLNKQVTDQGVVVLTMSAGQALGIFDPGVIVGGQRPDYFVQSLQVSSTGGTPGGSVELVGPLGPTPAPAPRFPFAALSTTSLDTYVETMRIVPAGYKLAFTTTATGPHLVRLTIWPMKNTEEAVRAGQLSASISVSSTPTGPAGGQLGGTYPNPDVRGLRETSVPTLLTFGAIADGQFLQRVGTTVVGAAGTTNLNLQYAENETESTNSSQVALVSSVTLTTASLPSANYLLFWQAHSATDITLTRKFLRIFQDGTTVVDDLLCDFTRTNDQRVYAGVKQLATLSGVHTFAIQHRMDEPLGTSRVLRSRIALIRVS